MTTEKPRKTLSGTITDIAFKKDRNDKEYVEVSLLQPGNEHATKCRAFDEDMVPRFHNAKKDTSVGLIIEESSGTYEGRPITYRNIVGITKPDGAILPPAQKERQTLPLVDTQANRERATNRRTALMQAQAHYQGTNAVDFEVLSTADLFDAWLNHEDAPSVAETKPQPNPEPVPYAEATDGEMPF